MDKTRGFYPLDLGSTPGGDTITKHLLHRFYVGGVGTYIYLLHGQFSEMKTAR